MHTEKINRYTFVFFAVIILVGFGTIVQGESNISSSQAKAANPYLNPYEACSYPGRLEIFKDGKNVSVIRSEKPNIERWGFIDSGNLIVVKSRGDRGPAVFELFDTATGALRNKIMATDIRKGQPSWTTDFAD